VEAELPVVLVNPWRVRRFGEGLGVLAKTDRIDARILALYGERARPRRRPIPAGRDRQMADFVARRRQIVAMIVAEKNRLETVPAWLRRDIQSLIRILQRRVARTLIVDLPELGSLGRREIASLVGLAPYARDSGRKSGMRRIRAGRPGPRSALYLAAMNGARFNPVLKPFYERLREAGKPPKLAFVALARKLLTILNAMVRDRTAWKQVNA